MVKKFPSYWIANYGQRLYCFRSPTEMYKIEAVSSNKMNEGVCVDHYITRTMVLKHGRSPGKEISAAEFEVKYRKLFDAIISKIVAP